MGPDGDDKGFKVIDRRGSAEEPPALKPADGPPPPADTKSRALPDIDFATFVMSLGSSALLHLGEIAGGDVNLPLAKQTIDILGMLAEKTRGNLSGDEAKLVEHLLYDLRLKYVEAKKRA
jgi:hypothetical protein